MTASLQVKTVRYIAFKAWRSPQADALAPSMNAGPSAGTTVTTCGMRAILAAATVVAPLRADCTRTTSGSASAKIVLSSRMRRYLSQNASWEGSE